MKSSLMTTLAAGVLAVVAGTASAAVYSDTTSDIHTDGTNPILDISSVEVTNDASNLVIKVNLVGNIVTTNWGKYLVGLDSVPAAGSDTTNGWGRPISMNGMDYWIGSWADGGTGSQLWVFNNPGWSTSAGAGQVVTANAIEFTVPLSSIGLASGGTLNFDVYTSGGGGGDTAIDSSTLQTTQTSTNWSNAYNAGSNVSTFNVVVPEPASLALLGLGSMAMLRRRK